MDATNGFEISDPDSYESLVGDQNESSPIVPERNGKENKNTVSTKSDYVEENLGNVGNSFDINIEKSNEISTG